MFIRSIAFVFLLAFLVAATPAATTVWDFSSSAPLAAASGHAQLEYRDEATKTNTSFAESDGVKVLHIEGQSVRHMHFPLSADAGGLRIQRPHGENLAAYTLLWDILVPAESFADYSYLGLFNTCMSGASDAELYIDLRSDHAGRVFADRDYDNAKLTSSKGLIKPDTWHRVVFVCDINHANEDVRIFVDGVKVAASDAEFGKSCFQLPGEIPVFQDGGGPDHAPGLVAAMALAERALSDDDVEKLGKPRADGFASISDPGNPPQPLTMPPAKGFTVALFPDTQNETQFKPAMLQSQVDWIVDNCEKRNIVYAGHLGDVTNHANTSEYTTAAKIMFGLNGAEGLVWGVAPGNHDMGSPENNANFLKFFGPQHFAGKSWYGDTTCQLSSYQVFHAQGRDYLVLCLEYEADATVLAWAQGVIDKHPGMPTIIKTHEYFTPGGDYEPYADVLWNGLIKDNPQIFLLVCGHHDSQGPKYNIRNNSAGLPVHELMTDYQQTDLGGGYLRLLEFDEENSVIHASAYSPYYNLYQTVFPYDQFDIKIDFKKRLGPAKTAAAVSFKRSHGNRSAEKCASLIFSDNETGECVLLAH